jgi:hypothetical protein
LERPCYFFGAALLAIFFVELLAFLVVTPQDW